MVYRAIFACPGRAGPVFRLDLRFNNQLVFNVCVDTRFTKSCELSLLLVSMKYNDSNACAAVGKEYSYYTIINLLWASRLISVPTAIHSQISTVAICIHLYKAIAVSD